MSWFSSFLSPMYRMYRNNPKQAARRTGGRIGSREHEAAQGDTRMWRTQSDAIVFSRRDALSHPFSDDVRKPWCGRAIEKRIHLVQPVDRPSSGGNGILDKRVVGLDSGIFPRKMTVRTRRTLPHGRAGADCPRRRQDGKCCVLSLSADWESQGSPNALTLKKLRLQVISPTPFAVPGSVPVQISRA